MMRQMSEKHEIAAAVVRLPDRDVRFMSAGDEEQHLGTPVGDASISSTRVLHTDARNSHTPIPGLASSRDPFSQLLRGDPMAPA
jgi:hypothetical protein